MIKTGKTFTVLIVYVCATMLSACSGNVDSVPVPVDVIFDSQREALLGGVRLAPPKEDQWDGYGEAVDVHGDVLVVGASEWNHFGPGSVYAYRFTNVGWQAEAQLTASDRDEFIPQARNRGGQRFGASVAVENGIIVVGAPGYVQPVDAGYRGAVYVFEYKSDTWLETAKLTPSQPGGNLEENRLKWLDYNRMKPRVFGSHVALDDDTLAVGGDADGTIYIYQRGADGWSEQTHFTIPTIPERDFYLTSMSLVGDTLAVSVYYLPPQPERTLFLTGNVTVYVFERTGNSWQDVFQFLPDDGKVDYFFPKAPNIGASVTLGGEAGQTDLLAVGLPGFPDWSGDLDESLIGINADPVPEFPASKRQSGAVYIFGRSDDGRWHQQTTLKPAGWDNPPGPGSFRFPPEESSDAEKAAFVAAFIYPGHKYSEIPEVSFFGATVDLDGNRLAVTSGFVNSTYIFEQQDGEWVHSLRLKPKNVKVELWEDYTQPVKISRHTLLLGTPSEFGNSAYVFDLCDRSMLDCR